MRVMAAARVQPHPPRGEAANRGAPRGPGHRSKELDDLVQKLRSEAGVKVDEAALEKLAIAPAVLPAQPGGAAPGSAGASPAPR